MFDVFLGSSTPASPQSPPNQQSVKPSHAPQYNTMPAAHTQPQQNPPQYNTLQQQSSECKTLTVPIKHKTKKLHLQFFHLNLQSSYQNSDSSQAP